MKRLGVDRPHLYLVVTTWGREWRAVQGIHNAIGHSPKVAFTRLTCYMAAYNRRSK